MGDSRPGMLSAREAQQLQLSLQSRSIREVALTVCTIRGLAVEVKSILSDLFHEEVTSSISVPAKPEISAYNVMPMAPPDPFQQIPHMSVSHLSNTSPSFSSTQKTGGFGRLLAKRGRRRHRCTYCPRTFTAQSSVWRHVKTHHSGSQRDSSQKDVKVSPSVKQLPDSEQTLAIDLCANQPDTSVATPRQTSVTSEENISIVSPLPSSLSQAASSPEDHLSPMPTISDMFNADSIKPEPGDDCVTRDMEMENNEMEIVSPLKAHYSEGEASSSQPPAATFPSPGQSNRDNEEQIKAAVDAQLMEPPVDGMYQCPDCGWRSKSTGTMRSHILSHKGILPFSCDICSYKTNKKHVLTRHYTIHTGEKPHKCPICTFGSLDHVELLKHMTKNHPGVHPFTCTICGYHATTNTLLKKHMKSEHCMAAPRQSPSSSRSQAVDALISTSTSGPAKNVKPMNVLSSSSETIFASNSFNQPVFP